jgi:hypothetical protein
MEEGVILYTGISGAYVFRRGAYYIVNDKNNKTLSTFLIYPGNDKTVFEVACQSADAQKCQK